MIVYGCFSCIQKMLGRTETRTRDRMYCQMIRTVRDISRDDRARIATCSLRTPTEIRRIIDCYVSDSQVEITNELHCIPNANTNTYLAPSLPCTSRRNDGISEAITGRPWRLLWPLCNCSLYLIEYLQLRPVFRCTVW